MDQRRQDWENLDAHLQRCAALSGYSQVRNSGHPQLPIEQGICEALNFHNGIGPARKQAHIGYLKNYWSSRAATIPKVKLHTSLNLNYSCAICGVCIDSKTPSELENALFDSNKIHTVGIAGENIKCVRVTPHVYRSIADLDKLVRALEEISSKA